MGDEPNGRAGGDDFKVLVDEKGEKIRSAKPFVHYPYAFYNKYGHVEKDVRYDETCVKNTVPRYH